MLSEREGLVERRATNAPLDRRSSRPRASLGCLRLARPRVCTLRLRAFLLCVPPRRVFRVRAFPLCAPSSLVRLPPVRSPRRTLHVRAFRLCALRVRTAYASSACATPRARPFPRAPSPFARPPLARPRVRNPASHPPRARLPPVRSPRTHRLRVFRVRNPACATPRARPFPRAPSPLRAPACAPSARTSSACAPPLLRSPRARPPLCARPPRLRRSIRFAAGYPFK